MREATLGQCTRKIGGCAAQGRVYARGNAGSTREARQGVCSRQGREVALDNTRQMREDRQRRCPMQVKEYA
jgi:hypothetical protein